MVFVKLVPPHQFMRCPPPLVQANLWAGAVAGVQATVTKVVNIACINAALTERHTISIAAAAAGSSV